MTIYFHNNLRLCKEKFTKSIFKFNCNYYEHTPIEKVKAFIKNKQGVSLKSNRVLRKSYDNENQQMELYLKKYDKKKQAFAVKYKLPEHKWGRIFPDKSLSLCVFHRPTRHAYAKEIYIDIDMKNAHPVIVQSICDLNGIPCPTISAYCADRENFLKRVCDYHNVDRSEAKTLMLRLTYGGEYEKWLSSIELKQQRHIDAFPEILIYQSEMDHIRNLVFEKNPHIIADVEKADPSYFKNPKYKTPEDVLRKKKKTCMSHFCNTIERYIQEGAIEYLVNNKGFVLQDDVVPCQDGFMIKIELWYNDILKEIQDVVLNKIGFNVEFLVKEFDEACEIRITNDDEEELIDKSFDMKSLIDERLHPLIFTSKYLNKTTDYDIASVIAVYYPDRFVCTDYEKNIWYEFDNHRWTHSKGANTLLTIINNDFKNIIYEAFSNLEEFCKTLSNESNIKRCTTLINKFAEILQRIGTTSDKKNIITELKTIFFKDKFEEKLNQNINLLCFTNGVFDCDTLTFRDGNPEDMCSICTNIELKPLNEEENKYMEDVKRRLFYEPLGYEVGDYFLLTIAQALAGKRLKRIYFGLGGTNRGKSTVTTACSLSFGDYIGSFNAENLAYRKSSQDEAQIMRWALLLRHKRIIFSNEMKSTVELNGNMIKKISSGGDRIIGRKHCQEETEFVCDFIAICMSNDLNRIKPYDEAISKRVRIIEYEKEFVDNPENEMELKKDPNLEKEMQTDLFKQVFASMVILRYDKFIRDENGVEVEPPAVANAKQEWTGDDGGKYKFVERFLDEFDITNNPTDYTTSKTIEEWVKAADLGISHILFTKELKAYCKISKFDNVLSKVKKVCGKNKQCWFGIKQSSYNPELESEE